MNSEKRSIPAGLKKSLLLLKNTMASCDSRTVEVFPHIERTVFSETYGPLTGDLFFLKRSFKGTPLFVDPSAASKCPSISWFVSELSCELC